MSKDLFTLENINKAHMLFSVHSEDDIYLVPLSSAHWCIHQLSTLSDNDIEQALEYLSAWDLVYEPLTTVTELTKVNSDVWRYCVAEPLSESNKIIAIVEACTVLGIVENEGVQSKKALLAASNFAFAILAKQVDDTEVVNSFDNFHLIEKKQKAAYAKNNIYYGPLKEFLRQQAEEILIQCNRKTTKAALTRKVYSIYENEILYNQSDKGLSEYHPLNNNGERLPPVVPRTVSKWLDDLITSKKAKPAK